MIAKTFWAVFLKEDLAKNGTVLESLPIPESEHYTSYRVYALSLGSIIFIQDFFNDYVVERKSSRRLRNIGSSMTQQLKPIVRSIH